MSSRTNLGPSAVQIARCYRSVIQCVRRECGEPFTHAEAKRECDGWDWSLFRKLNHADMIHVDERDESGNTWTFDRHVKHYLGPPEDD